MDTPEEQLADACRLARDVLDPNCDCNEPEDKDTAFEVCFRAIVRYEESQKKQTTPISIVGIHHATTSESVVA